MNKLLLIVAIIFSSIDCRAAEDDSSCKKRFIMAAVSDTTYLSSYIKYSYVGKDHIMRHYVALNRVLYERMRKNRGIEFEEYKNYIIYTYMNGIPLSYKKDGPLEMIPVDTAALPKLTDRAEFRKKYFGNGMFFDRHSYNKDLPVAISYGFDHGILINHIEENIMIGYLSSCIK